jgi:hypothetical protein
MQYSLGGPKIKPRKIKGILRNPAKIWLGYLQNKIVAKGCSKNYRNILYKMGKKSIETHTDNEMKQCELVKWWKRYGNERRSEVKEWIEFLMNCGRKFNIQSMKYLILQWVEVCSKRRNMKFSICRSLSFQFACRLDA